MTAEQQDEAAATAAPAEPPGTLRRSILAAVTGTSLEWYDFYLYGSAAALVFNKIFFPDFEPLAGALLALATYAVGFFARPLGGFVAGHFGDRYGRKRVLVFTVSLMGIATFLIGLLPSYATIGIAAPLLLVVLRLIQGVGLGGEWAGGALLIAERSPADRRGFFASFVQVGVPIGSLMSTGMLALFSAILSEGDFLSWGWRIPFLFSAVVVIVALVIRAKLTEAPVFAISHDKGGQSPVRKVLRRNPGTIVRIIGIRIGADVCYYSFVILVIAYVTTFLGMSESVALNALLIAGVVEIFCYPFWGAMSDRFGRRAVTLFGCGGCAVWALVFFSLLDTRSPMLIALAVLGGLFFESAMYGVQAAWISELFDTDVRYSGASISYQTASMFGAGIAPLIGVALLHEFNSSWPVVVYVMAMLMITGIATLSTRETRGRNLLVALRHDSPRSKV